MEIEGAAIGSDSKRQAIRAIQIHQQADGFFALNIWPDRCQCFQNGLFRSGWSGRRRRWDPLLGLSFLAGILFDPGSDLCKCDDLFRLIEQGCRTAAQFRIRCAPFDLGEDSPTVGVSVLAQVRLRQKHLQIVTAGCNGDSFLQRGFGFIQLLA